jgi:hypothetical protein
VKSNSNKSMMILIAGPYRSGTNDDPTLIKRNVQEMESYTLPIFRAGHIPILGEWLAFPLVSLAGSTKIGDDFFNEIFIPSRSGFWKSAMLYCASGDLRLARMKWSASGGALD